MLQRGSELQVEGDVQKRRVTAPDGTKWIVGRRWLLHRPRYFGFRFGVDESPPEFEPASKRLAVERRPAPTRPPTPPVVRYKSKNKKPRRRRRSSGGWSGGGSSGGWTFPFPSGRSGGGGGGRSSGGGSRGSSGGGKRGSSGGGKRGGGGAGAAGGILAALLQALKYIAIALAVIAAALFVVFVLIPSLVFLVQYLAFWLVIGGTIVYRALSGRPWIVEMEEADGYRVRSWRVVGWGESKGAIDEIAEAVRAGREPKPGGAEPVEIVNAAN